MTTPHKHADILRAIADGFAVGYRHIDMGSETPWHTLRNLGTLEYGDVEFRINPHKWQREIDAQKGGKAVQCRRLGETEWFDQRSDWLFDRPDSEFRIRPEVLRYRVARARNEDGSSVAVISNTLDDAVRMGRCVDFVEWLGDWQEAEVLPA